MWKVTIYFSDKGSLTFKSPNTADLLASLTAQFTDEPENLASVTIEPA